MLRNSKTKRILCKVWKDKKSTSLSYFLKNLQEREMGHRIEFAMLMCWMSFSRSQKPRIIHRICKELLRDIKILTTQTESCFNQKVDCGRNARIL